MRQLSPPRHADLMIAAAAAVGFASKGIFAKLLYARGWDFESVLTLRSLGALPIVWIWAVWR
ncbi:MAG: EamA/RhaT family transporter, partial [Proteobacteria bacterium]|nr:EamA/RhaT family transporter [Pseudomonadota bacterium]